LEGFKVNEKKIWHFGKHINGSIKAEYGKKGNVKFKQIYNDTSGMYIKDGKNIIWLTDEQEMEVKRMLNR
jgi:hypothetical protein